MYLEKINGPEDVKKLTVGQMNVLAGEVRRCLIEKLSGHGGHVGPNLGMVEATVALHYVFNSPEDKIVFDVSHQSYAHKILTGRKLAFMNPGHYDDVTHTCFYDIPLLANIPNLIYLAPSCREEYFSMLDWAVAYREHPVAVRVPVNGVISRADAKTDGVDWSVPAYEITRRGGRVAVLGLGSYYQLGEKVCDLLEASGIDATLVNPRIITSLDTGTLDALKAGHELVVTLEDGQIDGGWGEKIARYYGDSDVKVLVRGQRKRFEDHYVVDELLRENRLAPEQIAEDVLGNLSK